MIPVTKEQLLSLAPGARAEYLQAFENAGTVFAKYNINDNALRLAHFMAQVLHESGGFKIMYESLNYTPQALISLFSRARISIDDANKYGRTAEHPANERMIGNTIYGGPWGLKNLGNTQPDDGYNFRGTGLLQVTGRGSRTEIGTKLGVDLLNNPANAADPKYLLSIACEEWKEKGCNPFADKDDILTITKKINGGTNGLASRKDWLTKTKAVWPPAPSASEITA
ncbi:MAG TPA: glycoside hydrolase family 19 protein [Thermoanaerobaculia bacterium]